MMRGFAYTTLTNPATASALLAIVPKERIKTSGNATPATPFIVIRGRGITAPFDRRSRRGGFTVHIHDAPDSYLQIDTVQRLADALLIAAVPSTWQGHWVSSIEELGWSEDLFDDHYGTATRFGTYALGYSA
jgi:hypothetical protein